MPRRVSCFHKQTLMGTKHKHSAPEFQVGDLVRIRPGTSDPKLPAGRTGIIVVVVRDLYASNVYDVQFGTSILRFHPMWLEKIS